MKLSDIVIQEAAPDEDKTYDLKEVVKYFPNTMEKAVKTLAKSGRLTFGGAQVFTKSGDYGPALKQAIAEAEALLKDKDTTVDVRTELDGSVADIDDGGEFNDDYPVDDFQETFVGFSFKGDKLVIGFDAWLDEEIFNQDWDKHFEETFGEDFDMENPKHEKIFNKAHKEFKQTAFLGLLVEVNEDFHATMDDMPFTDGFHKGAAREFKSRRIYSF